MTTLFLCLKPGEIGFQMKLFCRRYIPFCTALYSFVFQIQCVYYSFMLLLSFASLSTSFTNVVNFAF